MSPFILPCAQSPRAPWQFFDTYVALDEASPVDASETQKGSGAQLASYLGLDIINNVREARDSLHRMADDFCFRNASLAKPHPYKAGDSVLLSTKNVNLNLPRKELSPSFVGPFTIRSLLRTNAVLLNYWERFQLLNPTVNIVYLRPYRLRTPDIGPPPNSLSAKPSKLRSTAVRGIKWKLSLTIVAVRVLCVTVSFVGKILMSFMTLGSGVTALLLLRFKLMSGF
jgi:hypothetical protein